MINIPADNSLSHGLDERHNADGSLRLGWQNVLQYVESLSEQQIASRQLEIQKELRGNGFAYGGVGPSRVNQRQWQLDVIPQIIETEDWDNLTRGLIQRARLKHALLSDIYNEQSLFTHGVIPPALVYAHTGYLRGLQKLPGILTLPLMSVDVARSPSGKWYATDDICEAPKGVGYALENRLVLARTLPDIFRRLHVSKLVGYFRELQALLGSTHNEEQCVILGYGPTHPGYFELAYLAKYLGYSLVEINDLTVRGNKVWLRTVSGLQRVDVILRFVDDKDIDPLAFNNGTLVGVAGLLQAAIEGNVRIINPIGTGILNNPAFNAYLPELCQFYLNEKLELLSSPTYWLGNRSHFDAVWRRFDELLYREINTQDVIDPQTMELSELSSLKQTINIEPERYIAQERIDRSLTPCLFGAALDTKQVTMRSYLIKSENQYTVMNGGLCLLDTNQTDDKLSLAQYSKDVWVLSSAPIVPDSMVPSREQELEFALEEVELPSRVAENLFWMGRQAERAENSARVLRVAMEMAQNESLAKALSGKSSALIAVLKAITSASGARPGFLGAGSKARLNRPDSELHSVLTQESRIGTLPHTLQQLQGCSRAVRDRLSLDMLRILNHIEDQQTILQQNELPTTSKIDANYLSSSIEQVNNVLISLAALSGITQENMTHRDGWRFMMLGRRIERARQGVSVIGSMLLHDRSDANNIENLLRIFDSSLTYRSRYRTNIDSRLVIQLLLMDEANPRSIAYQLKQIDKDIRLLPGMRSASNGDPLLKLATAGISRVRLVEPAALLESGTNQRQSLKKFMEILDKINADLANAITASYFSHFDIPHNIASTEAGHEDNVDGNR